VPSPSARAPAETCVFFCNVSCVCPKPVLANLGKSSVCSITNGVANKTRQDKTRRDKTTSPHRAAVRQRRCALHKRVFWCAFPPYVCPEPVLIQMMAFLVHNGAKRRVLLTPAWRRTDWHRQPLCHHSEAGARPDAIKIAVGGIIAIPAVVVRLQAAEKPCRPR
jgi:hypothetical protein